MRTALVVGGTGLVGGHLVERLLKSDDYSSITVLVRKQSFDLSPKLNEKIFDFKDEKSFTQIEPHQNVFCCLGTTIKKAGSKERFMKIEHDLPLEISRIAKEEGCRTMILISSMGANSKSKNFYSRVKGLLEEALEEIEFEEFHILRPSILLGKRSETRPTEYISKLVMDYLSFLLPWKYKPIHASIIKKSLGI